ncbi:MAG TPA: hypothetical protein VN843_35880, partial [Anaerolineales bacterium]|nr:hypothetical protein [Anaerolineales bacterium]
KRLICYHADSYVKVRVAKMPKAALCGAMRAAQLKDEELAFLIQVGRIIRRCRLANQNAALLDQFLSEHDCRSMDNIQGDIPSKETQTSLSRINAGLNRSGDASSEHRTVGPLASRLLTHRLKTFDRKSIARNRGLYKPKRTTDRTRGKNRAAIECENRHPSC